MFSNMDEHHRLQSGLLRDRVRPGAFAVILSLLRVGIAVVLLVSVLV